MVTTSLVMIALQPARPTQLLLPQDLATVPTSMKYTLRISAFVFLELLGPMEFATTVPQLPLLA